jgi:hypothetical protein
VVILEKGNLEHNTNDYSLLLWTTDEVFGSRPPEILVEMSSSSNRAGVEAVSWLTDNETIAFLGEHPGERHQVYTFNISTHTLSRITSHPTNVVSYSMTPQGDQVAYIAETPVEGMWNDRSRRDGVVVSTQYLFRLIAGKNGGGGWGYGTYELWYQATARVSRRLKTIGPLASWAFGPSLSPNGRFLVVSTRVGIVPQEWGSYRDAIFPLALKQPTRQGQYSWFDRWELVDAQSGGSRILVDGPIGLYEGGSEAQWLPDSRSVVVSNVFLPLGDTGSPERALRESGPFALEVEVPSGEVRKISQEHLRLVGWDSRQNCLAFVARRSNQESRTRILFCRRETRWKRLDKPISADSVPDVVLEQGVNEPPRIISVDSKLNRRTLLLDLNPELKDLRLGTEEVLHWTASDGHDVRGGLYYPVDYVPGHRYPLVVQGHGFDPDRFWIDGPFTTAYAAQPMAGAGIMVLQVPEEPFTENRAEIDASVASIEGGIKYLESRGMIDSSRIGIIGFSRTCLYTKYALTFSKVHFAAASVTDGVDGGYFQYIAFGSAHPSLFSLAEGIYGTVPFGQGMTAWMERSPGFNTDKVRSPVRIMALEPYSLLEEWEWFVALTRLSKPVEMVLLEDGAHILKKPWDRMASQQGNVDWFRFWLKGEEDPDPSKAEQYMRWRELRRLQQQQTAHDTAATRR